MSNVRSQREVIRDMLADLKMPGSLEAVDTILSDIDGGRLAATEAINRLLWIADERDSTRAHDDVLPTCCTWRFLGEVQKNFGLKWVGVL